MTSSRSPRLRGYLLAIYLIGCAILLSFAATAGAASARRGHHAGAGSPPANGTLAADAKKVKRCLLVNRAHPEQCAAARQALRRAAGARTAPRRHQRSARATGDAHPAASAGTSQEAAPSPQPAAPESVDAPTVIDSIAQTPSPGGEESSRSAAFQPGINSGSAAIWELPGAVQLGAKVVRIDMGIEESVAQLEPIIAAYAEKGIRVAPLAGFAGRLPTPAEAQNLASWARAFGAGGTFWAGRSDGRLAIQTIEFGNETSLSYQYNDNSPAGYASRAQTYALRFTEAARAIRAANTSVGLLAQGDSGNAGPAWVENMFKAVPGLGALVAGWTVHPYGPNWRVKFAEIISQTAAQGAPSTIPIDVTEWGLTSDNGRCLSENYGWNACMSYQEAAGVLSRTVTEMRQALNGRLGLLLLYQIRDQKPSGESTGREYYFGALQRELQPKGAYTTEVESLLASS